MENLMKKDGYYPSNISYKCTLEGVMGGYKPSIRIEVCNYIEDTLIPIIANTMRADENSDNWKNYIGTIRNAAEHLADYAVEETDNFQLIDIVDDVLLEMNLNNFFQKKYLNLHTGYAGGILTMTKILMIQYIRAYQKDHNDLDGYGDSRTAKESLIWVFEGKYVKWDGTTDRHNLVRETADSLRHDDIDEFNQFVYVIRTMKDEDVKLMAGWTTTRLNLAKQLLETFLQKILEEQSN